MQAADNTGKARRGLPQAVEAMTARHGLLPDGGGVLVGLSGGADSVALLMALTELAPKHGWRVCAAHFNHGIRGEAADGDERFCRDLCDKLGVAFFCGREDIPAKAAELGVSTETAGRIRRYDFLQRTAKENSLDRIAVAHHMDDNAESVLMHVLRGSGLAGLTGIKPERGNIIRPLLGVRRSEIEAYLRALGVDYRTDETNLVPEGTRNLLRLELIPSIERGINSAVVPALCSMAELLTADEEYLLSEARLSLEEARRGEGYDRAYLSKLPQPIRTRAIRLALCEAGAAVDIERVHVEAVEALLNGRTGARAVLPHAVAIASYELVMFRPAGEEEAAPVFETELAGAGAYTTPYGVFTAEYVEGNTVYKSGSTAYFDADKLVLPLTVRTRREGDRFRPVGAPGGRKLKEVFIDRKLPRERRDRLPLIAKEAEVLFIPGVGIADTVKADDNTRRMLVIKYNEENPDDDR